VSGPLLHDDQVKVHIGTAEVMARVAVLEGDEIQPGAEAWVQLRLADPIAAAGGDRLVVRRPSPPETIGGGVVVDTGGARSKRRSETAETLARRAAPSAAARLLAALDVPRTAQEAGERAGIGVEERGPAVHELLESGRAVALGDALIDRESFEGIATRALRTLALGHRRSPLRQGVPREEIRGALGLDARRGAALLARLAADGRLEERGPLLALPGHRPLLAAEQESAWQRARAALEREPLQPPSVNSLATDYRIDGDLLAALADRGDVVRVGDAAFLPSAVRSFAETVVAELATAGRITVARARDLTGSSRKHVLPLLQFLDDSGITRRIGDDRVLVPGVEEARARASRLGGGRGAVS
jgi:selenocysteine-specific elongation factor